MFTVKLRPVDAPASGAGFTTVTGKVPPVATSAVVMLADRDVLLVKVVDRGLPFHHTAAPFTKFAPLTVNENEEDPDAAELGLRVKSVGTGFRTVNGKAFDGPTKGAGFATVT